MSLADILGKSYKLESSENLNEYLKELDVGFVMRKFLCTSQPIVDLKKQDDQYILSTQMKLKNDVTKFTPGVELDQVAANGSNVKTIISIDGNTLHKVQKYAGGKESTNDMTFTPDELKMVMSINGVTAIRIYKVLT